MREDEEMSEIRKRFEALPEIANKLEHLFFEHGFYYRKYDDADQDEYFVNGAWYAFQEQQKKIDLFNKVILSLSNEFNLWADDTESFNAIEAQIENLEGLLR